MGPPKRGPKGLLDTITYLAQRMCKEDMTYVSHFPYASGFKYKQVRMYSDAVSSRKTDDSENFKPGSREDKEDRYSSSLSRTRRIIRETVYCNDLPLFFTITFDKNKVEDRTDLYALANKLCNFFKNYKQRVDKNFKYIIVPEPHEDDAIHFHGFCTVPVGLYTPLFVEARLGNKVRLIRNKKGYMRWDALSERFGHFSGSLVTGVEREASVNYCVSYIGKSLEKFGSKFRRFVFKSHGMEKAERVYEGLMYVDADDKKKYEFCEVAWIDGESLLALVKPWSVPDGTLSDMTYFEPFETLGKQLSMFEERRV